MSEFQKAIKYCAIGLAVLLVIIIISGIVSAVLGITSVTTNKIVWRKNSSSGKTIDFTDTFTGVESLDLENSSGDLVIKAGDEFKVEAINVTDGFEARVALDGTLKITERDNNFLFFHFGGFNNPNSKITLYIPSGFVAEKVKIDNGAGSVTIDELRTDKLKISAGAGNIKCSNIIADEVDIDGGVGNVTMTNVDLQDADINCGVGDLDIEGNLIGDSKIDGGVGNVDLTLSGSMDDYDLDVDSGVGSIKVNGEKFRRSEFKNRDARYSIKIDGGIGDVDIDFEN